MKTNVSPARTCAYKILYDVMIEKAFSNISVNKHLNTSVKNISDRTLCVNIVYGTLKKKNKLEDVITKLSKISYDKIDSKIKIILMMSLYQLFYLKKVPDYALINDAVSMSKFYVGQSTTGYVNAVLRSAQRQKGDLIKMQDSFEDKMHIDYGFAPWMVSLLKEDYSKEFLLSYVKCCEESAPVTVRVNNLLISDDELIKKLSEEDINSEKTYVPGVIKINSGVNVFASAAYKSGYFFAQDISGAISSYAMGFSPKTEIIDLCASPGAKSFNAAILSGNSKILSCDISKNKLQLLKQSAYQMKMSGIRTMRCDSTETNPEFLNRFDNVICDVPCSGMGVIRRKPEILYNASQSHMKEIHSLQTAILTNAVKYVKRGGSIIYSTCTINKNENERVVDEILRQQANISLQPITFDFELNSPHTEMKEGILNLNPMDDGSDGFFMAKLIKK